MRNPLLLTTSALALILASSVDVYANPTCKFCENSTSEADSTATAQAHGGDANGGDAESEDYNGKNDFSTDSYAGGYGGKAGDGVATAIAESFNQATEVISYQDMDTSVTGSVYVYGGAAYGGYGGYADVYIDSDNDADGGDATATASGGVGGYADASGDGGDADADAYGDGGTGGDANNRGARDSGGSADGTGGTGGTADADASGNGGDADGGDAFAVARAKAADALAASLTKVGDTEGGDGGDAYAEGGRLYTGDVNMSNGANGPVGGISNLQSFSGVLSGGNAGVSVAAHVGSISVGQ